MLGKIAIGLAAMAIAMGGATSGTLAQGGGKEAVEQKAEKPAESKVRGEVEKPTKTEKKLGRHEKTAKEEKTPKEEKTAKGEKTPKETTPKGRREARDKGGRGGVQIHLGGRETARREARDKGGRGGVQIHLGGRETARREMVRPETTRGERGGGRIHIHLGGMQERRGGYPGRTFAFRHAVPFHPVFHGGGWVHHHRAYGAMAGGQNVRIKIGGGKGGGEKARGEKRGGITLHVR
jgi:hypothetical protein